MSVITENVWRWYVSEEPNVLELVCQLKPKYFGEGLSVRTKIFWGWCVSED